MDIKKELWRCYVDNAAHDTYTIGIQFMGKIYILANVSNEILKQVDGAIRLTNTSKSHGNELCLRFQPTNKGKVQLLQDFSGIQKIMEIDKLEFDENYKSWKENQKISKKLNKGHYLEFLLIGRTWAVDRIPFYVSPDYIDKKGTKIQIKYEGGQFLTWKTYNELNKNS